MCDQEPADYVDRREYQRQNPRTGETRPSAMTESSAPMIVMPEMALLPDISGVCSRGGTFVMISTPNEDREHENRQQR